MESLVNTQQEVIAQTKMQLHFLRNNIKESQQNIHSMRKVLKSSRNKMDLNDVTAALFSVSFSQLPTAKKKTAENGAALTSLRLIEVFLTS